MRSWVVVFVVALSGCVESDLVPCGDKLCPVGSFCTPQGCVLQDQIDVCRNIPDGQPCQVLDLPVGSCVSGTCQIAECGNGVVEANETCDDGNTTSGDGCSLDCLSNETCGNGVIDLVTGEQCDSGVPGLSNDGCASTCVSELDIWHDASPSVLVPTTNARMVYDEARREIVLFGGLHGAVSSNETWVFKDGGWEERFPQSSPEPRHSFSMAYSPKLGKVVLFGGINGSVRFSSTWTWDGIAWTKLSAQGPSSRTGAAMAYYDGPDANDEVIMLYGGRAGATIFNDTWKFDGTAWTELSPGSTPYDNVGVYLDYVEMFFDPRDQSLHLIGGTSAFGYQFYLDKTLGWIYNELLDNNGAFVPAIQPAIGRLGMQPVLFGGQRPDLSISNDTYLWNTAGYFDHVAPATPPSARMRAAAAWDAGGMVVFGGTTDVLTLASTFRLQPPSMTDTAGRWVSVPTTVRPPKHAAGAMAYDPRRGDLLVVGGADLAAQSAESWRWHSTGWKQMPFYMGPRQQASLAYDEAREEAVLFGGFLGCASGSGSGSGSGYGCAEVGSGSGVAPEYVEYNETYVLKDTAWSLRSPAIKPPQRSQAAMTYVPGHGTLLFGGIASEVRLGDTWLWDGTTWANLTPSNAPSPMSGSRLTFDRGSNVAVMYGGPGALGTVWQFDIATLAWTEITPPQGPEPRANPVFVYNPRRDRIVLFGGALANGEPAADTWELDVASRTWQQRHPVGTPPARSDAFAVYDALNARVIMFGGRGQLTTLFDDVWTYSFESNTPAIERCDGTDADGDQLVDCNDPDCYPRCDPYCPPQTTCIDPRPRCGDGACAPVEAGVCDCP